jgi:hypothetical protein
MVCFSLLEGNGLIDDALFPQEEKAGTGREDKTWSARTPLNHNAKVWKFLETIAFPSPTPGAGLEQCKSGW